MSKVTFPRLCAALVLVFLSLAAQAQTCTPPSIYQYMGQNPVCAGDPMTLDAGPGWATYTWSNGATGQYMTDTPQAATSYTVTVSDGNGCTVTSAPFMMNVADVPAGPAITAPSSVTAGIEATASVVRGPDAYDVEWTITGGLFNSGMGGSATAWGETVTFTADGSGPVVLRARGVQGMYQTCYYTDWATKTLTIGGEIEILSSADELCQMATYTASLAPPATGSWQSYSWQISGGTFETPDYPYTSATAYTAAPTYRMYGNGPVTLTVAAQHSDGSSRMTSRQLSARSVPAPAITTSSESLCSYGSYTASVAPPAEGTWQSVYWTITGGIFETNEYPYQSTSASGATVSFRSTNGQPVQLRVNAMDSFGCYSAEGTKSLPRRTIEAPVITTSAESLCSYASYTASVAPPAEGTWQSVYWTITGGIFETNEYPYQSTSAGGATVSFRSVDNQPVQLRVMGMDSFGCEAPEATKSLSVRTIPAPTIVTSTEAVCAYGTYTASVLPPAEGTWQSVYWMITGGIFETNEYPYQSTFASGATVSFRGSNNQPVQLRVMAMDSLGCETPEATKTVGIRTIPAPTILAPDSSCSAGAQVASVAPPAEGTWQSVYWNITNGHFVLSEYPYTQTWAGGNAVEYVANGNGPVLLRVMAMDSFGCEAPEATKEIPLTPGVAVVNTASTVCGPVPTTATIEPPASGSYDSVTWTITNGTFDGGTTTATGTNVSYTASGSETIVLSVEATQAGGCSAAATVQVPVVPGTTTINAVDTVCVGNWDSVNLPNDLTNVTWSHTNTDGFTPTSPTSAEFRASGAGPVTIEVTATDPSGCVVTASKTIAVRTAVPQISVSSGPLCPLGTYTATITNASEFDWVQWTTDEGTIENAFIPTIQFTPGQYQQSITLIVGGFFSSGCFTRAEVTIPLHPQPNVTIAASGPTTNLCPGDPVTLTASGGTSWLWSTGETTQSITVSSQGRYTVTATDANSCANSTYRDVTYRAFSAPTISVSGSTSFCANEWRTLTAVGGPYDAFVWSNGVAGNTITVLGSGTYTVTGFRNGCSGTSAPVTLTSTPPPTITASATAACNGGDPVTLTSSEAPAYLWSTGETTRAISVTAPGTYWVETTVNGCTFKGYHSVDFENNAQVPQIVLDLDSYCPGVAGTAALNNPAAYGSFTWSIVNGTLTSAANAPTVTFTAGSTGTVELNVTAVTTAGCSIGGSVTAPVSNPIATFTLPPAVCTNTGTTVSVPDAGPGATYVWSLTNATVLWDNGASMRFLPTAEGELGVSVTVTKAGGCSSTHSATTMAQTINPVTVTVPSTVCDGTGLTASVTDAGEGATYAWQVHYGTITSTAPDGRSITFDVDDSYASVELRITRGSCSNVIRRDVNVAGRPSVGVVGPASVCSPTNVSLSAYGGTNYVWSNGMTGSSITVSVSGSYTVTATTQYGCVFTSEPVVVTVTTPPAPQVVVTPNPVCPRTETSTATVTNASEYVDYQWSVSHGNMTGTGATRTLHRNLFAGSYWVEVRGITASGCLSPATRVEVPETTVPDATITAPAAYCAGGTYEASVPDAGPGATYAWDIYGATIVSGGTSRVVQFTAGALAGVSLHSFVTGPNGCHEEDVDWAPVSSLPAVSISAPAAVCANATGATASVTNGGTGAAYAWTATNAVITGGQGTTAITFDATGGGPIQLGVTVTKGACSRNASATVAVSPVPVFGINAGVANQYGSGLVAANSQFDSQSTHEFCGASNIRLTATTLDPAWTYSWSTGQSGPSIVVSASGTYTLTATNASGCTSSSSATIVLKPAVVASIAGATSFCPGGSTTLTASGGESYLWSNGATTASITVDTAGTYSVTATTNGCSGTASATVTQSAAVIEANGPTSFCAGGSVTLGMTTSALSYLWSNGATTSTITVTDSGTYSVTATFPGGCELLSNAIVVSAGPSAVTVAVDDEGICPGQTVTATSNVTGGTSLSYQWLDGNGDPIAGATGATYSVVPTEPGYGTVSLRVTDATTGCTITSNTATYYRLNPAKPVVSGEQTFCDGAYTAVSATPGYVSYTWSNGMTGQSILVSETSTLTVTAVDASGCSITSDPYTVTEHAPIPPPVVTGPANFCDGTTATLTAPAGFNTYSWSNGMSGQSIAVSETSTVTVTVVDPNGCIVTSEPFTVTERAALSVPAITGPANFCDGTSATLTAPGGYASYAWSNGMSGASISVSETSTVTVTVTDANGCQATSAPFTVTERAALSAPAITGPANFCDGTSATLTAPAGYASYAWSNGMSGETISVSNTTTVTVTVTDANGCVVTSEPFTVTERAALSAPTITGPANFCDGTSATLTAPGGYASYAWSNGMSGESISVSGTTTVTVTVTDANGCQATSAPFTTTERAALSAPTITGPANFCDGTSATLTAPGGYASYAWSNGMTGESISVSETSTVTVTVTDANGCQATSAPFTVTERAALSAPAITGPANFCDGTSATLTAPGGYASYAWSNGMSGETISVSGTTTVTVTVTDANGCQATSAPFTTTERAALSAPTITGPANFCDGTSATLTAPGGYASYAWSNGMSGASISVSNTSTVTVTVTDANGCQATSAPFTTTERAALSAPTITGPANFCDGTNATLTAPGGYASYAWSNGMSGASISVSETTTVTVTVTDANGCQATSAPFTVTERAALSTPTITGPANFCDGTSATLTAPAGYASYAWSNGMSGESISVSGTTTVTVTVTDANGCQATSAPFTVTERAALSAPTITGPANFCDGTSATLTAPAGYASYAWSNGMSGETISVSGTTTVTVTVTDANGCQATSAPFTVTERAALSAPAITGPANFCDGTSATLTAPGGYASYAWSNGMSGESISVSGTTTVTVIVTDANGCQATSAPFTTTERAALSAPTITGPANFCDGTNATLTAPGGYASYAWSNGMSGASIQVSATTTVTVTVTDANGCQATSAPFTTTERAAVAKPTISGPANFCDGTNATLTATAGYASYTWSNGMSGQSIEVSGTVTVTVTVTDANGCQATSDPFTTTERAAMQVPAISGPSVLCPGSSVTLTAPAGYASYSWSNGQSGQSISVSAANTYTVTVTDANGCSITSTPKVVSGPSATTITTQPANITIRRHNTGTLTAAGTAEGGALYQWYRGNAGDTSAPVAGGTNPSLSVTHPSKGTYRYWVRVRSATCPGVFVNSNTAIVTVTN